MLHRGEPYPVSQGGERIRSSRVASQLRYGAFPELLRRNVVSVPESKPYRILEVCTNFILLNLLWLLACLPVVSAFPATAAMFAVVREWTKDREPGILDAFWNHLKENLLQGFLASLVWALIGAVLATDLFFIRQTDSAAVGALFAVLATLLTFAYAAASVYLFPVMVNYDADLRTTLKNSLLFALGHPGTTLLGLLVTGTAVLAALTSPFTLLVTGSLTAYLVYRLCDGTFRRFEASREKPEGPL